MARGVGRGKKTWIECIVSDMKSFGLRREDAQDREIWKGKIAGNRLTRTCADIYQTDVLKLNVDDDDDDDTKTKWWNSFGTIFK